MSLKVRIGCDPEIFFRDRQTGKFISAHDRIPGTKVDPFKVPGGAIQVDGTAAEINIDPAMSIQEFQGNVNRVITNLRERVPGVDLVYDPTVEFDRDYFESLPKETRELGCNPDFCAWTEKVNPSPDGDSTTMRTASGHIHVGWRSDDDKDNPLVNPNDPVHFEDCISVVKQLDYYVGMFAIRWDPDVKRRSLYGKAGAFRPKPYGVEYRTPSNVWLRSPSVQGWIFEAVRKAVYDLGQGRDLAGKYDNYAQDVINNNIPWWDSRASKDQMILKEVGLAWPDYKSCLVQQPPRPVVSPETKKKAQYWYGTATSLGYNPEVLDKDPEKYKDIIHELKVKAVRDKKRAQTFWSTEDAWTTFGPTTESN